MSTILITGNAGFLGSHLALKFIHSGFKVVGVDNMVGGSEKNLFDQFSINGKFTFYKDDICNLNKMKAIMDEHNPTIVIHTACFPHEGLSVCSPALVTNSVSVGTNSILSAFISTSNRAKRFVNMSSMARYGEQPIYPFTEDMIPEPVDPYGWAKYAAEGQAKAVCDTYGIEFINLVPHNIVGPRQKYDDAFRNVAAIMCNRVLLGKQPIIYGDGLQTRCFSYVEDLLPAIIKCCFAEGINGQTFNIGPDDGAVTINDLARIVCEIAGVKFKPIYMPGRPREVKHANCSAKKAREVLGMNFTTPLNEMIFNLFNYVKSNGAREFQYHLPVEIDKQQTPKTWTQKLM